jgi:hypothetical protein
MVDVIAINFLANWYVMQVCGPETLENPRIMSFARLFIMPSLELFFVSESLSIHLVCINNRGVLRAFLISAFCVCKLTRKQQVDNLFARAK